jgi:hypothetical protein
MRGKHRFCFTRPGCYPPAALLRIARVKRRGAAIWYGLGDMARAREQARLSLELRLYALSVLAA